MTEIYENNIVMTRGDTEAIEVFLEDEGGLLFPFQAGDKVWFTVSHKEDNGTIDDQIFQKYATGDDFEEGVAKWKINPEDTHGLESREFFYDVQITFANGDVKTLIKGTFKVSTEVTRD